MSDSKEFIGSFVLIGPQRCPEDGCMSAVIMQSGSRTFAECQICGNKLPDSPSIVSAWQKECERRK